MATVKTKIGTEESARKLRVEPTGGITATNTQKALEGLDTGKISATSTLTTHAMLVATGAASAGTLGLLTDGQLMIGQTGADPLPKTITGAVSLSAAGVTALTGSIFANPIASVGLAAVNGSATTAMRSDGAPALSQAIAPTWTGNHIFSPTTGIGIAVNPAAASTNQGVVVTQTSPTSGSLVGPLNYNILSINNQTNATGAGTSDGASNTNVSGFRVNQVTGGSNLGGSQQVALFGHLRNTIASNSGSDRGGVIGFGYSNVNTGNGILFGGSFGSVLDTGGQAVMMEGLEADVGAVSGTTLTKRAGIGVWNTSTGQASSTLDAGIYFTSAAVGGEFKKLFMLTNHAGQMAVGTSSDLFFSDTAVAVANIFNMANVAVSGNILKFANVILAGAGTASFGSGTAPAAGNIVQATVASGGSVNLAAQIDGTSGVDGVISTTSLGTNTYSLYTNEPSRTATAFGLTMGNWVSLAVSGAANNGLAIGTNTAVPIVLGTNNLERARLLLGLMLNTTTDPGLGGVGMSSGGQIVWGNDTYLTRRSAAIVQLGQADVAGSPVAQGLAVQNASGVANTAGANFTFGASRGTGTGIGGNFVIQTAPASGSSSTINSLVTAMTIYGTGGVAVGSAAADPGAGLLNVTTGFRIANGATSGNYLRGSGTNFISAALSAGDLVGTATNDNATAGNVGEYISANGGNISAGDNTATITIASPAVVTMTANPYSGNGTWTAAINFTTTGALPTGLVVGTTYWIIGTSVSGNTFQLATSIANALAGTAINTSGTQSGTHTAQVGVASVTTATAADVAAITVPAGDWDITGAASFFSAGGTTTTGMGAGASATTNTLPTRPEFSLYQGLNGVGTLLQVAVAPTIRVSLAAPVTYYMEQYSAFSGSTMRAAGSIKARRRR